VTVAGNPIKLSRTPGRPPAPAPALGENTVEVLERLAGVNRLEGTTLTT
jgi:crotonobetainyl-CoA:carnitine CoA-transferase CaiB-like acyl-CoA transferase